MGPSYVVFDLETTGLSPARDAIIQIAAMRADDREADDADVFFSYVNPSRPIPPWITHYTGITDRHVAEAPSPASVLRDFSRYVGGSTLIAHNGHRFDMRFLAACCQQHALPSRLVCYEDSIDLSRLVWGRSGVRHGLDQVLERLRIHAAGLRRHDARTDVLLLTRALHAMWAMARQVEPAAVLPRRYGVLPE
jgi:DNA polymerase III epsilon subunit family exonuclease